LTDEEAGRLKILLEGMSIGVNELLAKTMNGKTTIDGQPVKLVPGDRE
jgi:hypothetical protein